jgi:hypothetical protein
MLDEDITTLHEMAAIAVREHGIDADWINSDSIDDAVFPELFGEAVNAERFESYEAAEISDVLHEGIADTYWKLVDQANGIERPKRTPPPVTIEDFIDPASKGKPIDNPF